jgi:hypothetical protein
MRIPQQIGIILQSSRCSFAAKFSDSGFCSYCWEFGLLGYGRSIYMNLTPIYPLYIYVQMHLKHRLSMTSVTVLRTVIMSQPRLTELILGTVFRTSSLIAYTGVQR